MKRNNKIYWGDHWTGPRSPSGFMPAKNLTVGTKVVCLECRLSRSNWLRKTNANHGSVEIDGIISGIAKNGKRIVTLDKEQIAEWEEPIGDERSRQKVSGVGDPVDHIIKVIK